MDLGTILGIIFGFSLIAVAMSHGGGISWFLDGPSALIVFGGTIGATLVNYPLRDFLGVFSIAKHVFRRVEFDPNRIINQFVQMSRVARRDGILSLQQVAERTNDPFLAKAIYLIIDNPDPEVVTEILETEIDALAERHRKGADIFTTMGNFAPAMGLLGTLIGLIQMLRKMHDPSTIGPSMAVALITTFYGVILANLVFIPMAGKLRDRSAKEILVKQLILNGVLSLQAGDHPRVIEQKLHSFLAPRERRSSFGEVR
ncbi:MAG: MotA/TolQ/ExbB proton channel family protein [Syntrophales bacterium]|nr:MotA/TolQ/ExbB proton channel family protein [Syntrophales bacterium]